MGQIWFCRTGAKLPVAPRQQRFGRGLIAASALRPAQAVSNGVKLGRCDRPVRTCRPQAALRADGLITLKGGLLTIEDWDGLVLAGEFDPAYLHLSDRGKQCLSRGSASAPLIRFPSASSPASRGDRWRHEYWLELLSAVTQEGGVTSRNLDAARETDHLHG